MTAKTSLILVGMPGAGKSTVGVLLAKELAKDFVDTDLLIQAQQGKTLQEIIEEQDYLVLRQIEENILLTMDGDKHVIATGGSAIYSAAGMNRLKTLGEVIFLDVPLEDLIERIDNFDTRGIACRPGQSFAELFAERRALYLQFADTVIACADKQPGQVVREIMAQLNEIMTQLK